MRKMYYIIKTTLLRSYRDMSTNIQVVLFPILLIYILGSTFGNANDIKYTVSELNIHVQQKEESKIVDGLISSLKGISENTIIVYTDDFEDSKRMLELNEITCIIEYDQEANIFKIYQNDHINFESTMIEGIARTYVNRVNTQSKIYMANPEVLSQIDYEKTPDYVEKVSVSYRDDMSFSDYYAIAMITLFVLYGAMTPTFEMMSDREDGLLRRIEVTDTRRELTILAKLFAYTLIGFIRAVTVCLVSILIMDVNIPGNPLVVYGYFSLVILTMTSLGMLSSYAFKSIKAATGLTQLFIVVSGFFGGAYIPLQQLGFLSTVGKFFSINWWANKGLIEYLYLNDATLLSQGTIVFTSLSLLFIILTFYVGLKGEEKFDG